MQFRTPVTISTIDFAIDYDAKIVSVGSCFAENIAEKLTYFKFQNSVNPFGIIFNAVSMERLISRAVFENFFTEKDIFYHNDVWHCFEVHSDLNQMEKDKMLENLNATLTAFRQQILAATHFVITYGTSWVYKNIESQNIVANCHKLPQNQFVKELLSTKANLNSIQTTIQLISSINPKVKIIFTLSPVRHIKDGFVGNNVSKANLITAIFELVLENINGVSYFPSYEIMLDELRDYRFYKPDMLHPNTVAVDYIWQRFCETNIHKNAFETMKMVADVQKMLAHKPLNMATAAHKNFEEKVVQKILDLQKKHQILGFEKPKNII